MRGAGVASAAGVIRQMANEALAKKGRLLMSEAESNGGRPSIAPEELLRATPSRCTTATVRAPTDGAGAVQPAVSLVHRPAMDDAVWARRC